MWSRVFLLLWVVGYGVLMWCQLSTAAAQASSNNVSSTLFPPMGNSLQSTVKTSNAMHTYMCDNDESWILVRAAGELLDFDTEQVVGDYTTDFSSGYPVINFKLLNSAADAAESGSLTSSVSVSPIVTVMSNGTTESLSQATSHQNLGAASMVSYVVLLNPQGGQAPAASLCTDEFGTLQSISVKVPFSAVFEIYTQNVVPPPVPGSLNVPNARLIEGFFAQGSMSYQYNGSMWLEQSTSACLYNVVGGYKVGKFQNLQEPDGFGSRLNWHIFNPNGFSLTGQNFVKPVLLSSADVPWALFKITSSSGNTSLLGPYTFVQLVSSRGGNAPLLADSVDLPPGLVWTSPFSCIFWFYTNST